MNTQARRINVRAAVKSIELPEGLTHKWINCTQPPVRQGIYLRKPVGMDGPILYSLFAAGHWSIGVNDMRRLENSMDGHALSPYQFDARFEWCGFKEPTQ